MHNLKNIDVDIPLNQIVGIASVSDSGESSLALGVLYAKGSRHYLTRFRPIPYAVWHRRRRWMKFCIYRWRWLCTSVPAYLASAVPLVRGRSFYQVAEDHGFTEIADVYLSAGTVGGKLELRGP